MMRKLKHIVLLYLREPGFIILSTLSFLSLCAMQAVIYWGIERNLWNDNFVSIAIGHQKSIEILVHKYMLGDELLSFVFILGLWLMFTFGLLIKKQFANERAALLPNYRWPHVSVVLGILIFMIGATIVLSKSAMILSQFFFLQVLHIPVSLWAIYLVILTMGLTMLYLGYLSMSYIVVIGYLALIILAQNIVSVLGIVSASALCYYSVLIIFIGGIFIFVYRLINLKNEHIEYPFLLSWPPQKALRNQQALTQKVYLLKTRCLRFLRLAPREPAIPAFYQHTTLWARAHNWGSVGQPNIFLLMLLSFAGLPLYFIFLQSPTTEVATTRIETNFLLLSTAAVLLTIITNYKNMMFWSYDLIKPIRRCDFFKQQGVKVYSHLLSYWFMIVLYFAIIPDLATSAQQLRAAHFWAFLFLTLCFATLCLGWLATLSALRNECAVVGNGFVLCLIIMSELLLAGSSSTQWIVVNAFLCLILSTLFLKLAFEKWMDKEF